MIGFIPLTFFIGKTKAEVSLITIGSLKWQRSLFKFIWKKDQYFLIHILFFLNYERRKVRKKRAVRNV